MSTYDAVIIGGSGAVGRLIASLLAGDGAKVLSVDPVVPHADNPGVEHLVADICEPETRLRAVLHSTPLVVLAVPASIAYRTSLAFATEHSLVVETLSVKSGFATKIADERPAASVVGINPMFAPALGMDGRPVAAVVHRDGPQVAPFLARIASWGGRVVEVDADQHDRLAAATQALTHASVLAFGSALATLDVDPHALEAIAPPPATTSLALLARVAGGEPEVYWDVQAGNPYAARARAALARAVEELDAVVAGGSEPEFAALMSRAAAAVPDGPRYRALIDRLFGIVRDRST